MKEVVATILKITKMDYGFVEGTAIWGESGVKGMLYPDRPACSTYAEATSSRSDNVEPGFGFV
jgi:hypothetical protein